MVKRKCLLKNCQIDGGFIINPKPNQKMHLKCANISYALRLEKTCEEGKRKRRLNKNSQLQKGRQKGIFQ